MKSLDITFPANESVSMYIESEDDLSTDFWEYNMVYYNHCYDGETELQVYYPENTFSGYYTYLSTGNGDISESFTKTRGDIPSSFPSLNISPTIMNDDIENFEASSSGDADAVNFMWNYSDTKDSTIIEFYYNIYGNTNTTVNFAAPEIPNEIIENVSELLTIEKFEYSGCTFLEYDVLTDFDDYVSSNFAEDRTLFNEGYSRQIKTVYSATKRVSIDDELRMIQKKKKDPFSY